MKGIRFICIRSVNCPVILIVLFILTVWGYSCSKQPSKPKDIKRTSIDYFGPNGSTSMKIGGAEYTLIDDYVKWVNVLYQEKDFNIIEKHISDLLKSNDEAKSYELHILYHALATITNDKHLDNMRSVLDEWCNKHAKSHIPWLIRGIFHTKYAWTFRGGGPAITVPKDAWPKFHAKFELAQKDLEKSWEINPNDPNSSSHLIGQKRDVVENYHFSEAWDCSRKGRSYNSKFLKGIGRDQTLNNRSLPKPSV